MTESLDPAIEYRDIPGFPGYKVGADGTVWSCLRKGKFAYHSRLSSEWQKLNPGTIKGGYLNVVLCGEQRKRRTVMLHVLVLEVFEGKRPKGYVARHFPDPDRKNCAAHNVRWGTYKQNCEDRDKHGNTARGERNSNAKITAADVRIIRSAKHYGAVAEMGRRYDLSRTTIIAIRKRKTWKHVT